MTSLDERSVQVRLGTPYEFMKEKWETLTTFDVVRRMEIIEIIQYTLLYGTFALLIGVVVNLAIRRMDDRYAEEVSNLTILGEIVFELTIISVMAQYLRMIVQIVPSVGHIFPVPGFKPYGLPEYTGGLALAFLHLAMDSSLVEKVRLLSGRFTEYVAATGRWGLGGFFSLDEKMTAAPAKAAEPAPAPTPQKRVSFAPDALKPQIQMKAEPMMNPQTRLDQQFNTPQNTLDFLGAAEESHHPLSAGAQSSMGGFIAEDFPLQGGGGGFPNMGMGSQTQASNDLRSQLANHGGGYPEFMDGATQNTF